MARDERSRDRAQNVVVRTAAAGAPLSPESGYRVVRDTEEQLRAVLLEGDSVVLVGPPGSGKSSALRWIEKELSDKGRVVASVSLAVVQDHMDDLPTWEKKFIDTATNSIRDHSRNWETDCIDRPEGAPWLGLARELTAALDHPDHQVVLLIDEIGYVTKKATAHALISAVEALAETNNVTVVVAGNVEPEELPRGRALPWTLLRARLLGEREWIDKVKLVVPDLPDAALVASRVWFWTRGIPFLSWRLLDLSISKGTSSPAEVDRAAEKLVGLGQSGAEAADSLAMRMRRDIERRLTLRDDKMGLILLYSRLWNGKSVAAEASADAHGSNTLWKLGLTTRRVLEGRGRTSARIEYELPPIIRLVFPIDWAEQQLKEFKDRPWLHDLIAWRTSAHPAKRPLPWTSKPLRALRGTTLQKSPEEFEFELALQRRIDLRNLLIVASVLALVFVISAYSYYRGSQSEKAAKRARAEERCAALVHLSHALKDATDECKDACNDGMRSSSPAACRNLAILQLRAASAPSQEAESLLARACDAGDPPACERALLIQSARGEASKQMDIETKACRSSPSSCWRLGDIEETSAPPRRTEAMAHYSRACESGSTLGCVAAYRLAAPDIAKRERVKDALPMLDVHCSESSGLECVALGTLTQFGFKDPADSLRAAGYFDRACAAGVLEGCTNLGVLHGLGVGTGETSRPQTDLFERACAKGDWVACNNLGVVHAGIAATITLGPRNEEILRFACDGIQIGCSATKRGVTMSGNERPQILLAAERFRAACAEKQLDACVNLGALIANGLVAESDARGAPARMSDAYRLFRAACQGDSAAGCAEQASMIANGQGPIEDEAETRGVLQRACGAGEIDACVVLDSIRVDSKEASEALGALRALKVWCEESKVAYACLKVSTAYRNGIRVDPSPTDATRYADDACKLGGASSGGSSERACVRFAVDLVENDGRRCEGVSLLRTQCSEKRSWEACAYLKYRQAMTDGARQRGEALLPFDKDCPAVQAKSDALSDLETECRERGHPFACAFAADVRRLGAKSRNEGIDESIVKLAERGCLQGSWLACDVAGNHLAERGAEARAREYFGKSCKLGRMERCPKN